LRNGLDNAIKYTNSGGVVMGVRHAWKIKKTGRVELQIIDTGSGIENDLVPSKHKGWGFGSQIVRNLSIRIQAKIKTQNRKGKFSGTLFSLSLPAESSAGTLIPTFALRSLPSIKKQKPLVFLKGLSSRNPDLQRLTLPSGLNIQTIEHTTTEKALTAVESADTALFCFMLADCSSDLMKAQELCAQYARRHQHPLCLLVALIGHLHLETDPADYPQLVLAEAFCSQDGVTVPVLDDLVYKSTQTKQPASNRPADRPSASSPQVVATPKTQDAEAPVTAGEFPSRPVK
ncbi:MAG: ATP-binding protein, partial [Limnobacter sp.]|nr:ATP-binding protein [Limnobacter sp.]